MPNERLRHAINQAGIDPEGLADRVEVDVKTVQRWLAGRPPYPRLRARVARALGCEEHELWPEVASAPPVDYGAGTEILGAWARAHDPGAPAWQELLEEAIDQVELLDYSLLDFVATEGTIDTLAAKAAAGCRVRILISAPDSIWVRARAKAIGRDEEDYIGRPQLALEIETARGYLEPLTELVNIEIGQIYPDPGQRILRFDDELLLSPHLQATVAPDAPIIHLRRQRTGGLFDQLAAHFDVLARGAIQSTPAPELYPNPVSHPARYQPLTAATYQQHLDDVTKREDEKSEKSSRPLAQVRAELRRPPPPGSASFE